MFQFTRLPLILSLAAITFSAAGQYQPGQTYNSNGVIQPRSTPLPQPQAQQQSAPMYNMTRPAQTQRTAKPAVEKRSTQSARGATAKKSGAPQETTERNHASEDVPDKTWDKSKISTAPAPSKESYARRTHVDSSAAATTGTKVITNWATGKKLICLTYDDGPDPMTPKLLDYLKAEHVPATFYMLGERVKEYPHMVERVVAEGHEIGNHTYDHKQLSIMGAEKIRQELQSTHDLMTSASGGAAIPTMRPPYGAQNATVRAICEELGYKVLLWDVDTNDWQGRPAAQMINTIMKQTHHGFVS